jgi:hypothetical protein
MLGAGMYKFTKTQLDEYRNSVVHPEYGKQLSDTYEKLSGKGYDFGGKNYKKVPRGFDPKHKDAELLLYDGIDFGGKNYKKVPRGFDPEHKDAELLLYDGIHVGKSFDIPEEFYSKKFVDFCFKPFKEMLPVQKWLSDLSKRV